MDDPWPTVLAILQGAYAVPAIAWPAACTRIVTAPWPDEPDIELPPEPPEPTPLTDAEQALLEHLAEAGAGSVREVAAAVGMPRSTVCRGLHRLRDQGRVRLDSGGWAPAQ